MKILRFMKKNAVMCVAALAAAVSCIFVPPSAAYLDYFDFRTLTCLFITLAVMTAVAWFFFI